MFDIKMWLYIFVSNFQLSYKIEHSFLHVSDLSLPSSRILTTSQKIFFLLSFLLVF